MVDENCIFCKIISGDIPSNKVHESDKFLAFHDINPKAPIHILVIPKEHVVNMNDVTPEIMANITPFIQEVAKMIGLDSDGYRLITNIGHDGGQEVYHLHFHILGGTRLPWIDMNKTDETKKSL